MVAEQTLPATTYHGDEQGAEEAAGVHVAPAPSTVAGPMVNGRQTSITLLSPLQLVKHALLPSFNQVCNAAYREMHIRSGTLPPDLPRLPKEDSILLSVGKAPSTFTFVLHYAETLEVVATISVRRFVSIPVEERVQSEAGKTFEREGPVPEDTEAWELKLLAVSPDAQHQGLGALLVGLGEAEASKRFNEHIALARLQGSVVPKHLLFVVNTFKEELYDFYLKKDYTFDYEVVFPVGTLGTAKPFTVVHLSKPFITP